MSKSDFVHRKPVPLQPAEASNSVLPSLSLLIFYFEWVKWVGAGPWAGMWAGIGRAIREWTNERDKYLTESEGSVRHLSTSSIKSFIRELNQTNIKIGC